MSPLPNLVLIMADQWRGDCLSLAGHPVVQTPYLDQLALGGVRFNHAYSAAPTCIPARAALFTGLKPAHHGRVGYLDGVAWNYPLTLAGELTRHGYQSEAIGKLHVYPERARLGFEHVLLHDGFINAERMGHPDLGEVDDYLDWLRERAGPQADYFAHGVHCNSNIARPWDRPEELHPTNWVAEQSVQFLRRRDPTKPFFLFMSFHRPHPPYDPPAWAFEQYLDQPMHDPPRGAWSAALFGRYGHPADPNTPYGRISDIRLQRARAGYYGHITHIDHQINRFLWALRARRLLENTWIVFVSDHGELLGDHDLFRKGLPYEGSARVPLIIAAPPSAGLPANQELDALVELRDLFPTLLDCAGLPIPGGLDGHSLLPLMRGEAAPWRDTLHGEHVAFGQSVQWLTGGGEKYVWFSGDGREQLFDLAADPGELHDLAPDPAYAPRLEAWRTRLAAELEGREEGFVTNGALTAARPVAPCLSFVAQQAGVDLTARGDWRLRGAI